MKHIFVTGTDTDVGKTHISAALLRGSKSCGDIVSYWKPIQTGFPDSDSATVASRNSAQKIVETSFCYELPASPDQAASYEDKPAPALNVLRDKTFGLANWSIIEGAGGLLVPLNHDNETWIDYLKVVDCSVVLVARSGLGTLNHTMLSLDRLLQSGLHVDLVVLNGPKHDANLDTLKRIYPHQQFAQFFDCSFDHPDFDTFSASLWSDYKVAASSSDQSELINIEWDQQHCWHPFTQHKTAEVPQGLTKASGVWLETSSKERLIDGTSSWWSNTVGHGCKEIGEAIHRQQQTLDHVIFAGATHKGAAELSYRLSRLTSHKLSRVFYTDNGSCAVEVALKMAIQRAHNSGYDSKTKFITLSGAYHGDTFGAMSVSSASDFHKPFASLQFEAIEVKPTTVHASAICPEGVKAYEDSVNELRELFATRHHELAGVIIEPLVQGASGMNVQYVPWLEELCKLAKEYQVTLIFDEVFTGLGRCGDWFAYQRIGLDPDIVCLAKGLTGGTLPLAVTMATEDVFQAFYDQDKKKALYHGHTYTANATCCAAALATLGLYEKHNLISRSQKIEAAFKKWFAEQGERLGLSNPRAVGAIAAWEIPGSGLGDYYNPLATKVPVIARKHGLFLRPLGNTMYFVPPLTISDHELDFAISALTASIEELCEV